MSPIDPGPQLGIYLFATRTSISGYRHTSSFLKASYSPHATGFPAKNASSVAICCLFYVDTKIAIIFQNQSFFYPPLYLVIPKL